MPAVDMSPSHGLSGEDLPLSRQRVFPRVGAALVLVGSSACGRQAEPVDVGGTSTTEGLGDLAPHKLAFDGEAVWSVEDANIVPDEEPDLVKRDPHRVVRLIAGPDGELAVDADVDPLPPTALGDVAATGKFLVVAGTSCVDDTVASACEAKGVLRRLGADGWKSSVIQSGEDRSQMQFGITGVVDERHVLLQAASNDAGEYEGFLRPTMFDLETMSRVWTAPVSPGGTCIIEGDLYATQVEGGWMNPTVGEASAYDLVPVTYRLSRLENGSWVEVPNGVFEGNRPRSEPLQCTGNGYSTAAIGFNLTYLAWTPNDGWSVRDPDPDWVNASRAIPGSVKSSASRSVVQVDGQTLVQESPGVFTPLPPEIDGPGNITQMLFAAEKVLLCFEPEPESCRIVTWDSPTG